MFASFSYTYEHLLPESAPKEWVVEKTDLPSFDELIVSWNGFRPKKGKWTFWISLKQEIWSPWMKYAEWAVSYQKTFKNILPDSFAQTYQDAIFPTQGFCSGYRIKVIGEEDASLNSLKILFATVSNLQEYRIESKKNLPSIMLKNPPLKSQMRLNHPRCKDFCSPTSTSTALNYLMKAQTIDPVLFGDKIYDSEWDIYGNWILNTAQAYEELKGTFDCHVSRLNDFSELHQYLTEDLPVVVSIRGPIEGALLPYQFGHLICMIGYDATEKKVHCIDPAFPHDEATQVSYKLSDFLTAWGKRKNLAYIFKKSHRLQENLPIP